MGYDVGGLFVAFVKNWFSSLMCYGDIKGTINSVTRTGVV